MNVRVGENDASVLVVESDASIARSLRRTLGRAGYRVSVTPTLTAARGKLSAALDAAIVDVHVWDGAGEDVAREIFQRRLPCGLVLSSVASHDRAKTVARRWRADGLVLKPYTKPEVLEAVDLAARVGRCRKKTYTDLPDLGLSDLGLDPDPGEALLQGICERLRRIGDLAPRMAEALSLKVRGWPAKIAAEHLKVKLPTYYNTVKAALDRVGADSFDEVLRVVAADLSAEHARQSTI